MSTKNNMKLKYIIPKYADITRFTLKNMSSCGHVKWSHPMSLLLMGAIGCIPWYLYHITEYPYHHNNDPKHCWYHGYKGNDYNITLHQIYIYIYINWRYTKTYNTVNTMSKSQCHNMWMLYVQRSCKSPSFYTNTCFVLYRSDNFNQVQVYNYVYLEILMNLFRWPLSAKTKKSNL